MQLNLCLNLKKIFNNLLNINMVNEEFTYKPSRPG